MDKGLIKMHIYTIYVGIRSNKNFLGRSEKPHQKDNFKTDYVGFQIIKKGFVPY